MSFSLGKNTQLDFIGGLLLVRDTTLSDIPISLSPGTVIPDADPDVMAAIDPAPLLRGVYTRGARTMGFRFWGTIASGTAAIALKSFMQAGPARQKITQAPTVSKGNTLLVVTGTFSGSVTTDLHPVTGASTPSVSYNELSLVSVTYEQDPRVRYYPSASPAASRELYITIDCLGADIIVPELSSISGGARIICGAWHID